MNNVLPRTHILDQRWHPLLLCVGTCREPAAAAAAADCVHNRMHPRSHCHQRPCDPPHYILVREFTCLVTAFYQVFPANTRQGMSRNSTW